MNMLATYDAVMSALAKALESTQVQVVKASLDDIEFIKLRARQVRDKQLLAKAIECQMRVERQLGFLMARLIQDGRLRVGRPMKVPEGELPPVSLAELGIDKRLSVKVQRAADMASDEFEAAIVGMCERMASNKAILVDPIDAHVKSADLDRRRADHAARALTGGNVKDLGELALSGYRAGFIGSDPQWKFLTRSEAGEGRSANVHYKTEEVDRIKQLPVGELAADGCVLGMWMVDWCPQDALDLIKHYGFQHVTTLYTWIKTNGDGALDLWDQSSFFMGQGYWTRANPEDCWLATKGKPKRLNFDVRQLIVAPVMEHSRKPDEWLARSERLVEGPYLELQARRPRKGWTSWGDELEFTGVAA